MKQGRKRRMKRDDRKVQITHAVEHFTGTKKGYATQTDVAKYLGMSPSSHLLSMLKELWIEDEIEMNYSTNSRGNKVYQWYSASEGVVVCDLAVTCDLPWECPCLSLVASNAGECKDLATWNKLDEHEQNSILSWHIAE